MKTSAILSPANITQSLAPAKQADGANTETPFKQILSRETSKVNARESNAPAPQTQAQAQPSGSAKTKAADAGNAKETAAGATDDSDTAQDAASTEMLALVANLTQVTPILIDPAATEAANIAALPTIGTGKSDAAGGLAATDLLDHLQAASPTGAKGQPDQTLAADLGTDFQTRLQAASLADKPVAQTQNPTLADAAPAPAANASAKADSANPGALAAQDKPQTTVAAPLPDAALSKPVTKDAAPKSTPDLTPDTASTNSTKPQPETINTLKPQEKPVASPAFDTLPVKIQDTSAVPSTAMVGQMQHATLAASQAVTANATEKLTPQVGSPGWDQALGQKVVWMVAGGQQSASLTLNPPDLGPLQVVLNISNSQATASFTAAQPEVRQALEAAMPKLREMLAETGIQLGQTTVSTGMPNQNNSAGDQPAQNQRHVGRTDAIADIPALVTRPAVTGSGRGLVDTFA